MAIISKIIWKSTGVEVIDDIDLNSRYFWLNKKHIEEKIGHSGLRVVTNKYNPVYKKRRFELVINQNINHLECLYALNRQKNS